MKRPVALVVYVFIIISHLSASTLKALSVDICSVAPRGDLAPIFNKGMGIRITYLKYGPDRRLRVRAGYMYTKFNPRLDTFPQYLIH